MTIQWLGMSCFKIQSGETTLITDPYKGSGAVKTPRIVNGEIVVHSNAETVGNGPKEAFVISEAGEYEVRGVFVRGIETSAGRVFLIETEGVHVAFLGHVNLIPENGELELIEHADILIVPVGGTSVLDGKLAAKLATTIEPRVVIPMLYATTDHPAPFNTNAEFLKEMGTSAIEEPKYKVSTKTLPVDRTDVVILTPQ